jgi:hypothetical protein
MTEEAWIAAASENAPSERSPHAALSDDLFSSIVKVQHHLYSVSQW